MSNKLRFNLILKPHPYPEDPASHLEVWGNLSVCILLSDEQRISLLDIDWDLSMLIEWVVENQDAWRRDTFIIGGEQASSGENLAQALVIFQDRDFTDEEEDAAVEWFDDLYEFRRQHSLRFGLRGTEVPGIIIGSKFGVGEISVSETGLNWAYKFDMEDFCRDLKQKLQDFLAAWSNIAQDSAVRTRIDYLLDRLG